MDTVIVFVFFFNDTATTEIYTLSLHDALPISRRCDRRSSPFPRALRCSQNPTTREWWPQSSREGPYPWRRTPCERWDRNRSEEHTSELQSRQYLVCRLLLEKKKKKAWSTSTNT